MKTTPIETAAIISCFIDEMVTEKPGNFITRLHLRSAFQLWMENQYAYMSLISPDDVSNLAVLRLFVPLCLAKQVPVREVKVDGVRGFRGIHLADELLLTSNDDSSLALVADFVTARRRLEEMLTALVSRTTEAKAISRAIRKPMSGDEWRELKGRAAAAMSSDSASL